MKEIEILGWGSGSEEDRVIVSMDRNLHRALEKLQGDGGVGIMDWARRLMALKDALRVLDSFPVGRPGSGGGGAGAATGAWDMRYSNYGGGGGRAE